MWSEDVLAPVLARSICVEMHAGFSGVRSAMWMNVCKQFPGKGCTIDVQADIGRLSEIWETCLALSGPDEFLFGDFSIVDAYFSPDIMRFRTSGVVTGPVLDAYVERAFAYPTVLEWVNGAMAETERMEKYDVYSD